MTTTNKIVPSSTVATSTDVRKWVLRVIIAIAIIIAITIIASLIRGKREAVPKVSQSTSRSEVPLASAPVATWQTLVIPPGGRSVQITVPTGMHVVMLGNEDRLRFRLHNVYQDGRECAYGDACTNGPLAGVYATNESKEETNVVSYAFEPKK